LARALECFEPARIPSHDLALATTF
jgi:hypothetical protein